MKTCPVSLTLTLLFATLVPIVAQAPLDPPPGPDFPPGFTGPPPFGPGRGPGGPGPMQEETKLVKQFDADTNGRLDHAERRAAREFVEKEKTEGRGRRQPGPPGFGGRREDQTPPTPGAPVSPAEVSAATTPLYDSATVRTLFLDFENADWEKELATFYSTDVEVPARLTVDGQVLPDVGIHFRGASSFFTVGEGRKRSLNLSVDFAHPDQRLNGYRTLNLLNSHEDPTMLRAVLYHRIAREYLPSPQANFVRVVINGENWGVYVSVQQFNKDFVKEWFGTSKGARWKAPGSPMGQSGLEYLGDDVAAYKKRFEIKSKDDPQAWRDLIELCRVLNQTLPGELEAALASRLDIDGALKFLALENALINSDGYWVRASDYSLYQDEKGRFHIIPHDTNETFRAASGPGAGGGRGPGGPRGPFGPDAAGPQAQPNTTADKGLELDPLIGLEDARKPLRSKLLAVPALRERYLGYVRDIAERWLDWNKLGPIVAEYQALISDAVKADTRKLDSFEAFSKGVTEDVEGEGMFGRQRGISLKRFADERRAFLLNHPEVKRAGAALTAK